MIYFNGYVRREYIDICLYIEMYKKIFKKIKYITIGGVASHEQRRDGTRR